jgi:hypothetical protein
VAGVAPNTTINLFNGPSGTITVSGSTINFNKNANISIFGTGQNNTFFDGENNRRVMNITAGNVTLNNLTV